MSEVAGWSPRAPTSGCTASPAQRPIACKPQSFSAFCKVLCLLAANTEEYIGCLSLFVLRPSSGFGVWPMCIISASRLPDMVGGLL